MKSQNLPPRAGAAPDPMAACPVHAVRGRLRQARLRPTRQRLALGWLLFARGNRHVTAEGLFEEAVRARFSMSLATVYNTLHQFTEAGLLREIAVGGARTHYDTNAAHHHHFLTDGRLLDIDRALAVGDLPPPPDGMEIDRIDIIVRLKPRTAS